MTNISFFNLNTNIDREFNYLSIVPGYFVHNVNIEKVMMVRQVSKVSDGEFTIFPNYGFSPETWAGSSNCYL